MNKIPAGYKKTEVGIIPEDWEITTVGEQFSIQLGKMLDSEKNVGVSRPYLGNRAVQWGRIDVTALEEIRLTPADLKRYRLQKNDLLVCEGGEIGRAAIWKQPINECYYQKALHRLRPLNSFNIELMLNILWRMAGNGILNNYVTQTSIAHLPKESFEKVPFAFPPSKAEQEAIATALNDADALITQLEKLIAKKRLIKQGAMQQFLKPQPGWQSKKLGEIAEVVGGGTPSTFTPSYWNGNINWFTPTEIGDKKYSYQSIRKITQEGFANSSAKLLSPGTILLTSRASIGDVSILMTEGCTNQGFQSLVAKEAVDSEFLYYLALTLKPILQQNASGSTFLEISPKKLKAISIKIPDKSQQISISQALSDIDKEIDALEARLAKHKQIKQGMMQTLLTGKIRLL